MICHLLDIGVQTKIVTLREFLQMETTKFPLEQVYDYMKGVYSDSFSRAKKIHVRINERSNV